MKIDRYKLVNKIIQCDFHFNNGDIVTYTYNDYTKEPQETYVLNNRTILIDCKKEHQEYILTIQEYIVSKGLVK